MDKESIIELQKIDCNCNDCKFMQRDLTKFNKWKEFRREQQLASFKKRKAKVIENAQSLTHKKSREVELRKANKLQFQFDSSGLISYGNCTKLNKKVSFIPGICQIENQQCFKHRQSL